MGGHALQRSTNLLNIANDLPLFDKSCLIPAAVAYCVRTGLIPILLLMLAIRLSKWSILLIVIHFSGFK